MAVVSAKLLQQPLLVLYQVFSVGQLGQLETVLALQFLVALPLPLGLLQVQ
ncbi:hypothetical protein AEST_27550 [Alishewanella aestuarii B11]|uniref:Uncharacterized protein n=1 Tax=Alishewanella aestuarii B11 TaxID=1197174 RepID=J2ICT5_9ALTE|nr:hypothetical protein AEST_27550 [Alishewanella aestuarii B11]